MSEESPNGHRLNQITRVVSGDTTTTLPTPNYTIIGIPNINFCYIHSKQHSRLWLRGKKKGNGNHGKPVFKYEHRQVITRNLYLREVAAIQ